MNSIAVLELRRRGMAATEDGLFRGLLRIVKRNKPAAVVLTETESDRLADGRVSTVDGLSASQWLLGWRAAASAAKPGSTRRARPSAGPNATGDHLP